MDQRRQFISVTAVLIASVSFLALVCIAVAVRGPVEPSSQRFDPTPPQPVASHPVDFAPRALPDGQPAPKPSLRSTLPVGIQHFEPDTKAEADYAIRQGVYRQANINDERRLVVQSEGRGQLVLDFVGIPAAMVGANRVVIETTWAVEGDDVTFTLHGGNPKESYQRVLAWSLDEVTRFHIEDFQQDELTLVRATDGEVFRWVKEIAE